MNLERSLVIAGVEGSGKTTISEIVAREYDINLLSINDAIQDISGYEASKTLQRQGSAEYSAFLASAVFELTAREEPGIIELPAHFLLTSHAADVFEQAPAHFMWFKVRRDIARDRLLRSGRSLEGTTVESYPDFIEVNNFLRRHARLLIDMECKTLADSVQEFETYFLED